MVHLRQVHGLWCSACRCKVDGELIFYNEAYLAPLAEEIKKSEYIYYTARQTQTGQRYLVVHDGMDVLAAIMPMNILKEEYINDLAEFQALCMEQFYKDKERREAVIEEAEDDPEDAAPVIVTPASLQRASVRLASPGTVLQETK